jgi:hypothetical protein
MSNSTSLDLLLICLAAEIYEHFELINTMLLMKSAILQFLVLYIHIQNTVLQTMFVWQQSNIT